MGLDFIELSMRIYDLVLIWQPVQGWPSGFLRLSYDNTVGAQPQTGFEDQS
jgi:hypothetical protein